jgi:FAD/FMN-containing dehydrogenase
VLGLRGVSMQGEILTTGVLSDNNGFNIQDLLIGSEGTLVVVTQMMLRLSPQPSSGVTILVAFDKPTDAASSVYEITRAGIRPTVMEYLDDDCALCSNQYEPVPGLDRAGAILLLETSGVNPDEQSAAIEAVCRRNHCSYLRTAAKAEEVEILWKVRRNLSKAVEAMAKYRLNEDVAVPVSRFLELIQFVADLNRSGSIRVNAFGHAGDGNLHVSFLSQSGTDSEERLMEKGIEELMHKTIELGGTLSGEHGIGLAKRDYLHLEFSTPLLEMMRRVKHAFDPKSLLNPDKIFPAG